MGNRKTISTDWYYLIKIIAIIAMVTDHLAKSMGERIGDGATVYAMIWLGRIAMPLFCYELTECFHFTKHRGKHLASMFLLALVSEIPCDRALYGSFFEWKYQNVCWTLALSWIMLIFLNADWNTLLDKLNIRRCRKAMTLLAKMSACLPLFILTMTCKTDYLWHGMGLVLLFEFARTRKHIKLFQLLAICVYIGSMGTNLTSLYASCFLCLIPIYMAECSKKAHDWKLLKSKSVKYICKYFYPAHLAVLAGARIVMGV